MEANRAMKRKQHTGEEMRAIPRKHHLEGVLLLDVCHEHQLQLTEFYP